MSAEATAIEPRDGGYAVTFGDGEGDHIQARSVVIAAGVRYRRLPIERLEEFEGVSIYYAATIAEAQHVRRRSRRRRRRRQLGRAGDAVSCPSTCR